MSLLPVDEALARATDGLSPIGSEDMVLKKSSGRTLAADLISPLTQPPFDGSAMDGYAVRASDVETAPVTLTVIGEAAAGHEFSSPVKAGETVRIFTGAPLPEDTDTIIIQENTTRSGDLVTIQQAAPKGNFVRPKGGDFAKGDILIKAGTKLSPRQITLAAAANQHTLTVSHKPAVAIIATGDELVAPGGAPKKDQIISSSPYGIAAMVERAGGVAYIMDIARDTMDSLHQVLEKAQSANIIVTIGGASEGDHDLVQQALKNDGVTLDFWKIAMRPGKPLMFGHKDEQRVLGLPGNPVSAMVCARIFLVPMIQKLCGQGGDPEKPISATLTQPLPKNGPRQHYMRGTLFHDDTGAQMVEAFPDQDSSLQKTLADANCLIVRPPHAPSCEKSQTVSVLPIDF